MTAWENHAEILAPQSPEPRQRVPPHHPQRHEGHLLLLTQQAAAWQDRTCDSQPHGKAPRRGHPSPPAPLCRGTGSRRLFGAILERKVCILLDTSGSMGPHLQQVKTELILLIWEQLRKHCDG